MNRLPTTLLSSCLLLTCFVSNFTEAAQPKRPNFVFLMADDQNVDSMGCYGTINVKTKNLDQLAADGMVFDNHYTTTAICMASRANVLTGMFEYKTGCNFSHGPLLRSTWNQSYPVLLRQAGYLTAFAGKIGLEVADAPKQKSQLPKNDFDWWGASPSQTSYVTKNNASIAKYAKEFPHSTRAYGAFGRDFIAEAAKSERPFCLSISFKAPHQPVQPDPVDKTVYQSSIFPEPGNYGRELGAHLSPQSRTGRQFERFHSWHYSDQYNAVMAKHHQQIYAIDAAVGMIRDALAANHVDQNTVVIYTSDNGFLCGSHGYGSKVLPYEEACRVPLIVYDPRHECRGKGLRCDALTGNVDFAPTLLTLAGLPVPDQMDGRDLMTLLDTPEATIHESLPLINVWGPKTAHSLAVVTKDWKFIYWPHENQQMKATEELFHTSSDPLELKNLIADESHTADLNKMQKIYDATLTHWKTEAVPYHRYQPFGTIFDRGVPWDKKAKLVR